MDQKRFDIGESISYGWEAFKANAGLMIVFLLIIFAAQSVFNFPNYFVNKNAAFAIFNLISFVLSVFIAIAVTKFSLRLARGGQVDLTDVYTGYPYFLNMLLSSLLYGLLVMAGLILLIIPGIYWGIRYQFFPYLIVDQNLGPVNAIKRSGQITRGEWWHLFLYGLAAFGLSMLGFLACCIGTIITTPIIMVAHAHIYARLASSAPPMPAEMAPAPAPGPTPQLAPPPGDAPPAQPTAPPAAPTPPPEA
jgi:uncharacterized membrane protein